MATSEWQTVLENGLHARTVRRKMAEREDALAELSRLGEEIEPDPMTWVCVTHAVLAPCPGGKNRCVYSASAEAVAAVRQQADAPPA